METQNNTVFQDLFQEIKDNKDNHDSGDFNCIPFTGFNRLEKLIPGVEHGTYTIITANSGVGKSKLARSLYIHNPYNYILNNPQYGIEVSILYFCLEESRKKVVMTEICKHIFKETGQIVSLKQLQSRGRYNSISRDLFPVIAQAEEHIDNFLQVVDIIDNIRNPTGIYKYVRDFALKIGTYYDKYGNPLNPQEIENIRRGVGEDFKKISFYRKHNPKHYVIVVTDHISLLDAETVDGVRLNQHQTMGRFSNKYCLHMRDKFGFTVVNVQQQASDKERIETNFRGETIAEKLEPSMDGLGNNKETQRDADIVVGLFGPNRYGIGEHLGFDIYKLKDHYRSYHLLKDRDGESNKKLSLFFNGAIDLFREMPLITSVDEIRRMEAHVLQLEEERRRRGE